MKILLLVGIGSFIGGVLRYLLSMTIQTKISGVFPLGTLTVNILGCLIIGVFLGMSEKMVISQDIKFLIATGLLGGFTTFSAISVETFTLIRLGHTGLAAAYVSASIMIGLVATFIGFLLIRLLQITSS